MKLWHPLSEIDPQLSGYLGSIRSWLTCSRFFRLGKSVLFVFFVLPCSGVLGRF